MAPILLKLEVLGGRLQLLSASSRPRPCVMQSWRKVGQFSASPSMKLGLSNRLPGDACGAVNLVSTTPSIVETTLVADVVDLLTRRNNALGLPQAPKGQLQMRRARMFYRCPAPIARGRLPHEATFPWPGGAIGGITTQSHYLFAVEFSEKRDHVGPLPTGIQGSTYGTRHPLDSRSPPLSVEW